MINLRLPNITGQSDRERMKQMESYMFQLVQDVNFALTTMENEIHKLRDAANHNQTGG